MNESDRMQILNKMEELQTRVGALAAATKLIEQERAAAGCILSTNTGGNS